MTQLSKDQKQRIIEEEQVRAEARQQFSQPAKAKTNDKKGLINLLKIIGILILILIALKLWFVAIPVIALVLLWRWKKINLSRKHKLYITGAFFAVIVVVIGIGAYATRTPSIRVSEPQDGQSFQSDAVLAKGSVKPRGSKVTINNDDTSINNEGAFEKTIPLQNEQNTITIEANNYNNKSKITLTVNRIFTDEEKAERERLAQEQAERQQQLDAEQAVKNRKIEYIAKVNKVNDSLTKAFSTIGPIFLNKSDVSTWSQTDKIQVAGYSVVIEQSYEAGKEIIPPKEFQQVHSLWLQALKKYANAMPLMRQALDERNAAKLNRATQLISEGQTLLEKSTAEIQKATPQ
jgi:glucodextranase-like protein